MSNKILVDALRAFISIHECRKDLCRDDYHYAYLKAKKALTIDPAIRICDNCEREYRSEIPRKSGFCPECDAEYEPGPTEADLNDETIDR